MRTLTELALTLEAQRVERQITFDELAQSAGLSRLAVRRVLRAEAAPRATTLMALADKLGLELVLLPQHVAAGFAPAASGQRPLSRVEQLKYGTTATHAPTHPALSAMEPPPPSLVAPIPPKRTRVSRRRKSAP